MTLLFVLIIVIVFIILATSKFRLHPFLTLLIAALVTGIAAKLNANELLEALVDGFGGTLKSIGIVIACGTIIGTFLENSGGARQLAERILTMVGERQSALAMNLTGYFVSIPVFCDSGFVILSALNRALSRRTGRSLTIFAIALATGLYATHVFVPPTPGPLAAAATLGADVAKVILLGLVVSIIASAAGLLWATAYCKRYTIRPNEKDEAKEEKTTGPSAGFAFAPLLVPIVLIALKSVANYPGAPLGTSDLKALFSFVGHPVIALLIGVGLAFLLPRKIERGSRLAWVDKALKNAGAIILITGAGGAFGGVLKATPIGEYLGTTLSAWQVGIFLPFIIAAALKTAQGSSTVAIITTAALVAPMLPAIGLASETGKVLAVLAIGAGSMTVSHTNDSYFWVVAQFSDMDTATALRCHTMASLIQGITAILTIALLSVVLA